MTAIIQSPTAALGNEALQEPQDGTLENLTDTERRVFTALLLGGSNKEAIELSPVKERQFYTLKKKLLPFIEQLKQQLRDKSWQVLIGSTVKAAQVMSQGLEHPSTKIRVQVARDILDRTLGKPQQHIESVEQKAITVLNINATPEELRGLTEPLSPLETDNIEETKVPDI